MSTRREKKRAPSSRADARFSDHHRRATSVGGSNHPDNRIYIVHSIHELYHDVFRNLCVPRAVIVLNKLLKRHGIRVVAVRVEQPLHKFICPQTHKFGSRTIGCCEHYFKRPTDLTKRRVKKYRQLMHEISLELGGSSSLVEQVQYMIEHVFDLDYRDSVIEVIAPAP